MKRIFTLLFLVVAISGYAQNKFDVLAFEDFNSGVLPTGWAIYDVDGLTPADDVAIVTDAWVPLQVYAAGDYEMTSTSWYTPAGASDDWLCSNAVDLSGLTAEDYDAIVVNFTASSWSGDFPDGYEVYVSTTGQEVADFLAGDLLLTIAAENTDQTSRTIDISAYVGETVYVAIRNNSDDKWFLFIDDFAVIGISGYDAQLSNASYKVYNQVGSTTVALSGFNLSASTVSSLGVEYSIDGGAPVSENIAMGNTVSLSAFEANLNIPLSTAGAKSVSVTLKNLDGNALDVIDPIEFPVSVIDAANEGPRRGLVETFTSSTCAPCEPGNATLHSVLDGLPSDEDPVVIKFQQPFPGVGDGYMTVESDNRRTFYGVNAIPNTRINGSDWADNTNGITAGFISAANDETGYFDIEATYEIDVENKTVSILGTYTPRSAVVENTRLQIAIQENRTVNNVGNNGETEFFDVFKKFIGNEDGIAIEAGITVGEAVDFQYSYTFQGEYRDPADASNPINNATENSVENFDNLEVTLWVESVSDQRVLNANYATRTTVGVEDIANINEVTVFPNPIDQMLNVTIDVKDANAASFELRDVDGRLIRNLRNLELTQGTQTHSFDVSNLQTGLYYISITNDLGAVYMPIVKK